MNCARGKMDRNPRRRIGVERLVAAAATLQLVVAAETFEYVIPGRAHENVVAVIAEDRACDRHKIDDTCKNVAEVVKHTAIVGLDRECRGREATSLDKPGVAGGEIRGGKGCGVDPGAAVEHLKLVAGTDVRNRKRQVRVVRIDYANIARRDQHRAALRHRQSSRCNRRRVVDANDGHRQKLVDGVRSGTHVETDGDDDLIVRLEEGEAWGIISNIAGRLIQKHKALEINSSRCVSRADSGDNPAAAWNVFHDDVIGIGISARHLIRNPDYGVGDDRRDYIDHRRHVECRRRVQRGYDDVNRLDDGYIGICGVRSIVVDRRRRRRAGRIERHLFRGRRRRNDGVGRSRAVGCGALGIGAGRIVREILTQRRIDDRLRFGRELGYLRHRKIAVRAVAGDLSGSADRCDRIRVGQIVLGIQYIGADRAVRLLQNLEFDGNR